MPHLLVWLASLAATTAYKNAIYTSEAFKGVGMATMRDLEPNFIPHGQCSGLVSKLECAPPEVEELRVRAADGEAPPTIVIQEGLAAAEIYRKPNRVSGECEGEAPVQVGVACSGRRRAATRPLATPAPRQHIPLDGFFGSSITSASDR